MAEYAEGIRAVYMDKVRGVLSENDYIAMTADFSKERDRLGRVIADDERQLDEINERIEAGGNRRELIEQYTRLDHLTREMVDTLIGHVTVGRRKKGEKTVLVEIFWNF